MVHTAGCKFVKICDTPGCRITSVCYSRQYQQLVLEHVDSLSCTRQERQSLTIGYARPATPYRSSAVVARWRRLPDDQRQDRCDTHDDKQQDKRPEHEPVSSVHT